MYTHSFFSFSCLCGADVPVKYSRTMREASVSHRAAQSGPILLLITDDTSPAIVFQNDNQSERQVSKYLHNIGSRVGQPF